MKQLSINYCTMNKTVDWCTEKMQTKHILWVQKKTPEQPRTLHHMSF